MAGDVAPTQDLVVERSIHELNRRVRDRDHARLWAASAVDPALQRQTEEILDQFAADDRAARDRD